MKYALYILRLCWRERPRIYRQVDDERRIRRAQGIANCILHNALALPVLLQTFANFVAQLQLCYDPLKHTSSCIYLQQPICKIITHVSRHPYRVKGYRESSRQRIRLVEKVKVIWGRTETAETRAKVFWTQIETVGLLPEMSR